MLTPVRDTHPKRVSIGNLPVSSPDPGRIAVLLNRNARRVTDRLAKRMERVVGSQHMYYSRSLDEAQELTREIVQRGYGTVVCGGGDGTLAQAINLVRSYVDESNAWRQQRYQRFGEVQALLEMPRFAFLKLGTGNGIQRLVGAQAPLEDLARIVDYVPGRTFELPLVESNGERFFFGGMGYDSMLLNDYTALKSATQSRLLRPFMHTMAGYVGALLTRTLPRVVRGADATRLEARITTRGKAYFMDPRRGDAALAIEPGSVLYEGKARMIAAATSPYFGYGIRMFPFSNTIPRMMQIRVTTIGPFGCLANLPAIWKGTYRNPKCVYDFLAEDIHIELARPFPFQHSGDAQGMRSDLSLRIAPDPLKLVDYMAPPMRN